MKKKEPKDKKSPGSIKQFEQDLPIILKKYNVRVSKPFGCYPEDVEAVLTRLEEENNNLAKENTQLAEDAEKFKKQYKEVQAEFTKFKMQVQLMKFETSTPEADEAALQKGMQEITNTSKKPTLKISTAKLSSASSDKKSPSKSTFDDLISPRKKNDGGKL